ncbi:MAG: RecX family transcriptional regulator [Clostridiaceae bacterium]|nr:RecX family transcriptional regulator [Clostridiaceae bacterium]
MRITGIEQQKKNIKRYNIYIDGEYRCSVDSDILQELGLSEEMELDETEFNKTMEIIQYKGALRAALYILARTPKTESDIEKRLIEKQHPSKAIQQVMEYLKEIGYINDESYVESYIRSIKDITGTSRRSILQKLVNKGVDKEIIQQKLDEADIDDYESAIKAAKKKVSNLKGSRKEKKLKLLSYLYRKGFEIDACKRAAETLDLEGD